MLRVSQLIGFGKAGASGSGISYLNGGTYENTTPSTGSFNATRGDGQNFKAGDLLVVCSVTHGSSHDLGNDGASWATDGPPWYQIHAAEIDFSDPYPPTDDDYSTRGIYAYVFQGDEGSIFEVNVSMNGSFNVQVVTWMVFNAAGSGAWDPTPTVEANDVYGRALTYPTRPVVQTMDAESGKYGIAIGSICQKGAQYSALSPYDAEQSAQLTMMNRMRVKLINGSVASDGQSGGSTTEHNYMTLFKLFFE